MKKSTSKSKLIVESRIGTLFTMTVGEWNELFNYITSTDKEAK